LKVGDLVVAGAEWGRVRALVSDTGETIDTAGPSTPVEVLASPARPMPAIVWPSSKTKPAPAKSRDYRARQSVRSPPTAVPRCAGSLEQMMAQAKTSGRKEFPLIIKADVQGSLEAIIGALDKMATDEVAARAVARPVSAAFPVRT